MWTSSRCGRTRHLEQTSDLFYSGSRGAKQGTIGDKVRSVDDGFISVANSCLAWADNRMFLLSPADDRMDVA